MALIMGADHLLPDHGVSAARLLQEAVDGGYSSRGEMFHAAHLSELAREVFELDAVCEADWDVRRVACHILDGGLALVPYDVGPDHSPVCAGGSKSHWALLCGVACVSEEAAIMVWEADMREADMRETAEAQSVAFVAQQSKSRRLALWQGDDLHASNYNLHYAAERKAQGMMVGDSLGGIRGKIVFLFKASS